MGVDAINSQPLPFKKRLNEFFAILKPYFWPKTVADRIRALSCFVALAGSKGASIVAPIFLGQATDKLTEASPSFPLQELLLLGLFLFAAQALQEFQRYIYLSVKEVAYQEIAERTFIHLHSLSLDWHLSKRTGEVLRAMDRGIASASNVVNMLFLRLVPSVVELLVLCILSIAQARLLSIVFSLG